jgi:hypothetical protein
MHTGNSTNGRCADVGMADQGEAATVSIAAAIMPSNAFKTQLQTCQRTYAIAHPWQWGQLVTPGLPKSGPLIISALQAGYGQYSRSSASSPASAACQDCNVAHSRMWVELRI